MAMAYAEIGNGSEVCVYAGTSYPGDYLVCMECCLREPGESADDPHDFMAASGAVMAVHLRGHQQAHGAAAVPEEAIEALLRGR